MRARALPPVHILYENPDWMPPLVEALEQTGFEARPVLVHEGRVGGAPASGIWLNRMSPSSHTRGHETSVALMRETLAWLEAHDVRVVNGLRAFELEMSKMRQFHVLSRHGILTPRTVLAVGRAHLLAAARGFDGPFITKHNQGGKGLGIVRFDSAPALADHLRAPDTDFDLGPNQQVVLQQYIEAPEPFITRVEIVGHRMIFAMRSATTEGFELCPSDACQTKPAATEAPDVCPADASDPGAKFSPSPLTADDPLVARYVSMMAREGIEVAGIEFVEDAQGRRYTYDINGTTNYNRVHGERIGVHGMVELARYLRDVVAPAM